MNKFIGLAILALSTNAMADYKVDAKIKDFYKIVVDKVPYTVQSCDKKLVPSVSNQKGGDDLGAFIIGALIGSAVGNQVSSGDGAGAIGAIVGGAIANEHQKEAGKDVVTGHEEKLVCTNETRYEEIERQVYSHSEITFRTDGQTRVLSFRK